MEVLEDRTLLSATVLPTAHPAILDLPQSVMRQIVPGELIVAYLDEQSLSAADSTLGRITLAAGVDYGGAADAKPLLSLPQASGFVNIVSLRLSATQDVQAAAEAFESLSGVAWAAPNFQYSGNVTDLVPNDTFALLQTHHSVMQNQQAWDTTVGSPSVIIAITDTGVEWDHPDLAQNIWANDDPINGIDDDGNGYIDDLRGWDFVAGDNDPTPFDFGEDYHGTHVAGIAAARINNTIGVAGVAGGSTIMPLRIYGTDGGFTSTIMLNTFKYAIDNGAKIVCTSFNIDGFVGDSTFTAGLQYLYDQGGLHFNSAGNETTQNPLRQAFGQTLIVAATESDDTLAPYSNYGRGVDISAPGSDIYSTITFTGYEYLSGTSMAAPNAAAAAALIWSAHPTWTRDQVAAQLLGSADSIDALNSGYAGQLGAGRVNSFKAVTQTLAAPRIRGVAEIPAGVLPTISSPGIFTVQLGSIFAKATIESAANWQLRSAGSDGVIGTGDDAIIPLTTLTTNYMIGTNEVKFSAPFLPQGKYRFTAISGGLADPFGVALDGDADGLAGGAYTRDFLVDNSITLLDADFSNSSGAAITEGFTSSGTGNQWHLSTGRGFDGGHTSDDSFYFGGGETAGGGGLYNNNASGTLTSGNISLVGAAGTVTLEFNHFLKSEVGLDFARVQIWNGTTTTTLATSGSAGFPHQTSGFEHVSFDISAFVGQTIQVRFNFTSNSSNRDEGWYVDDVSVKLQGSIATSLISGSTRRDLTFDPVRNMLYVTTSDGYVQRYNSATGGLLAPWKVGTSLRGADVTADGNYLYVAEDILAGSFGVIHKVNLTTGQVTDLTYNLGFQETGGWDLVIASNNKAYFTSNVAGSSTYYIHTLDVTTDVFGLASRQTMARSQLSRSGDRTALMIQDGNISSGPFSFFNATTNTWDEARGEAVYQENRLASVSRDGKYAVVEDSAQMIVYDRNYWIPLFITQGDRGAAFSPTQDLLFVLSSNQIVALDTVSWQEKYRIAIGENISSSGFQSTGQMTVSGDGTKLFLSGATGVRVYTLPAITSPNSVKITNLPFSTIVAGTAQTITVTMLDAFGAVATGYRGTVQFSSSDLTASLPANYTFTAADNGVKTFNVTFNATGSQTLTIADTVVTSLKGFADRILVSAAATSSNIWVHGQGGNYRPIINEFTQTGQLVRTFVIPLTDTGMGDMVADADNMIHGILGSQVPVIATLDLTNRSSKVIADWSATRNTPYTNIAVYGNYLYFTHRSHTVNGFDRMNKYTGAITHYNSDELHDLNIGLDRKLYTLQRNVVRTYDLVTMNLIRTVILPDANWRAIAINEAGDIFAGMAEGRLTRFNSTGTILQDTTTTALGLFSGINDLEVSTAGTLLIAMGDRIATVNQNFTNVVSFSPPADGQYSRFVSFATPQLPSLNLSINNGEVVEGNSGTRTITFTATLSLPYPDAVTVQYSTQDVTATAGSDYVLNSGTLTFSPGQTTKTITVTVNGDTVPEGHETFRVVLSNPTEATLANSFGVGAIRNDDLNPLTDVNAAANLQSEGTSGATGLTVSSVNPDPSQFTYSLLDNAGGRFSIDPATGVVSVVAASSLNYETATSHTINVQAANGVVSTTGTFTVNVDDVLPTIPTDVDAALNYAYRGDTTGAATGVTVHSTEPNGPAVAYSLDDSAGGRFAIHPSTGVVTVQNGGLLDPTLAGSHTIVVRSTVGASSSTASFVIGVLETNLAPTALSLSPAVLAENSAPNTAAGAFITTDPNPNNLFTYTLVSGVGSDDNALFNISGDTLRATSGLNFEAAATRSVRVRTTDQGGLFFEHVVTINVTDVNESPFGISPGSFSVNEAGGPNMTVGTFTSSDPDAGNTFIYSLVDGFGSSDNALFNIVGDTLRATDSLDFESDSTLNIRIRTTDQDGLFFDTARTVVVSNVDEPPVTLSLSAAVIAENNAANAVIGTLSSSDQDAGSSFTYSFATGDGDTDNAHFNLSGTALRATASLDFEAGATRSVRLRTTDNTGLFLEQTFTITVTDVNEAPTAVALDVSTIAENDVDDAIVGSFVTTDPDADNTFTYSLVTGAGSTDNALFTLSEGTLLAATSFDFEAAATRSVRVRATDQNGLFVERALTITVTNVNEAPIALVLGNSSIAENAGADAAVGSFSTTDPDAGNSFTYTLVAGDGGTDNALFNISGDTLRATNSLDYEAGSSFSVRVRTTDQDGLSVEDQFSISVINVVEGDFLAVASFSTTSGGFVVQFTRPIVAGDLNLYDQAGVLGPPDLTFVGNTVGAVRGSLIINAAADQITFVKTGGVLANDTYTITLRSAANGFRNASTGPLDGNADGTGGDDFVTSFTHAVGAAVTVSLPDFVRGYGQPVNVPNTGTGLPLTISTGQNVSAVELVLLYDPTLLAISGFTKNAFVPGSVEVNLTTPGRIGFSLYHTNELSATAGTLTLGTFSATIPDTAVYGGKEVLDITALVVFDNSPEIPEERPSIDDDAVHLAAYFGDTTGNRILQSNDATLVARVGVSTNTGYSASQAADPALLSDISGNGVVQSNDATAVVRAALSISISAIPAIPAGITPPATGLDPVMRLGSAMGAVGDTVVVPVIVSIPPGEPAMAFSGYDLRIQFDPAQLTYVGLAATSFGSSISTVVNDAEISSGFLIIGGFGGSTPILASEEGEQTLLNLTFTVNAVASGVTILNLMAGGSKFGHTALFDANAQETILNPAPTDAAGDASDGTVTVISPAEQFVGRLYQSLLGRTADPAGLSFWSTILRASGDRQRVVLGILGSGEYLVNAITDVYRTLLGREPDSMGLAGFQTMAEAGTSLETVRSLILASDEYFQTHGGEDEAFLAALYHDGLGRPIDPQGQSGFSAALAGGESRMAIVAGVVKSPEAGQRRVNAWYQTYLGRDADALGMTGWLAVLDAGAADVIVLAAILASSEYENQ